ncbi:MAG: hypothetical protein ACYSYL_20435 [Planctomycetota bacterium]
MRTVNPRNMFAACVFLSVIVCPAVGNIIYVNEDATGSNNGTSWQNAYTDLQSALSRAVTYDQILVAAGTYKPGTYPNDSFCMENGVGIYGGFPDSGDPNMADRDWHSNPTILSGDIGVEGYNQDNCRHVFTIPSGRIWTTELSLTALPSPPATALTQMVRACITRIAHRRFPTALSSATSLSTAARCITSTTLHQS